MNVQATESGYIEQRLGKDLSIGGDHDEVGGEFAQGGEELGISRRHRLQDRNSEKFRLLPDRRGGDLKPASDGTIRLCGDGSDCHVGRCRQVAEVPGHDVRDCEIVGMDRPLRSWRNAGPAAPG